MSGVLDGNCASMAVHVLGGQAGDRQPYMAFITDHFGVPASPSQERSVQDSLAKLFDRRLVGKIPDVACRNRQPATNK